jgi:hypothetical protein
MHTTYRQAKAGQRQWAPELMGGSARELPWVQSSQLPQLTRREGQARRGHHNLAGPLLGHRVTTAVGTIEGHSLCLERPRGSVEWGQVLDLQQHGGTRATLDGEECGHEAHAAQEYDSSGDSAGVRWGGDPGWRWSTGQP